MIGAPEYQLAKFLDSIIKPYILQTYMLQSTNQFIKFNSNHKLVSFDLSSLFTNVPLKETIHIIADTIYSDQQNPHQPILEKGIFIKLLQLATKGIFMQRTNFTNNTMESAWAPPWDQLLQIFFEHTWRIKCLILVNIFFPNYTCAMWMIFLPFFLMTCPVPNFLIC